MSRHGNNNPLCTEDNTKDLILAHNMTNIKCQWFWHAYILWMHYHLNQLVMDMDLVLSKQIYLIDNY